MLIFLHIPKAAGTTFHQILDRKYEGKRIVSIDGLDSGASVQAFKEMPDHERAAIDLLKGHMPFGLHEYVSSPATYVTFLRDPVERVISYYYYVCRSPEHYLYDKVTGNNLSLAQFVEAKLTTEVIDFQVKMIAGKESALRSWQHDPSLLELAWNNIERYFSVVGFTEYFDQSLLLIKQKLGWRNSPCYQKRNVTKGRAGIDTIDRNIIGLIREYNSLDCQLYDWALKRFKEQLRTAGITDYKVNMFRLLNRFYSAARFCRMKRV